MARMLKVFVILVLVVLCITIVEGDTSIKRRQQVVAAGVAATANATKPKCTDWWAKPINVQLDKDIEIYYDHKNNRVLRGLGRRRRSSEKSAKHSEKNAKLDRTIKRLSTCTNVRVGTEAPMIKSFGLVENCTNHYGPGFCVIPKVGFRTWQPARFKGRTPIFCASSTSRLSTRMCITGDDGLMIVKHSNQKIPVVDADGIQANAMVRFIKVAACTPPSQTVKNGTTVEGPRKCKVRKVLLGCMQHTQDLSDEHYLIKDDRTYKLWAQTTKGGGGEKALYTRMTQALAKQTKNGKPLPKDQIANVTLCSRKIKALVVMQI